MKTVLNVPEYAVCPGYIRSRNDGDLHYVSFNELCGLYGVAPAQCANMNLPRWRKAVEDGDPVPQAVLRPRYDGRYELPRKRKVPQPEPVVFLHAPPLPRRKG